MNSPAIIPAKKLAPLDIDVPFRWGSDEIASVRTLARNILVFNVSLPPSLLAFSRQLLGYVDSYLYASSGIEVVDEYASQKYAFDHRTSHAVADTLCTEALSEFTGAVEGFEIATCREQCFHHDEVRTERHAYVALVLAQTKPLAFHSMGSSVTLKEGDLIVFDAQQPHALIREGLCAYEDVAHHDFSHRFVFGLGTVPLTLKLRKLFGMRVKQPASSWRGMRSVNYSENTGEFV